MGKPLPSQLFSLEPKKKVLVVAEEGDFVPFFPNYNSINQVAEAEEEEAWLTEVKMKRREEERLLQMQRQKIQQELFLEEVQRKEEESQRYKKEIMLDQLRKQHEARERQKLHQNVPANAMKSNPSLFNLGQLKREDQIRMREQEERER